MFKIFTLIMILVNTVISKNCFTQEDIFNKGLVSYENKVYDIDNYIHPGGMRTLLLSKGKSLEEFFNQQEYSFHKISDIVVKDLEKIYIGVVNNTCNITNNYLINNTVLINPYFQYSIITLFFSIITVFSILTNDYCIKNIFFKRYIDLNFLGYMSIDIILFYILYFIWWSTLLIMSFLGEDILIKLGIWISINIGFTLLPINRNSLWITYLKLSYNKLIIFHKLISILTSVSVIIKILYIIFKNNFIFLFSDLSTIMGTICSLTIILTIILATPLIRQKSFELFYYSHKIFIIIIIITMSLHYIECLYIILPSIILYFGDIYLRLVNIIQPIYSTIDSINFSDTTTYIFITLNVNKTLNIKPGSYFFICCNNISNLQWHPFTLISKSKNNLLFCAKSNGKKSWSNDLKILAENNIKDNFIDFYLQGPYNHLKMDYNLNKYEYIINIANGIGITPFISILNNIFELYNENKLDKLKKCIFIWIVPEILYIKPFLKYFKIFYNIIDIQIFVAKNICSINNLEEEYCEYIKIINYKPNIFDHISSFLKIHNIKDPKNTCIISCGSPTLLKDIHNACYKFKIELFNENF